MNFFPKPVEYEAGYEYVKICRSIQFEYRKVIRSLLLLLLMASPLGATGLAFLFVSSFSVQPKAVAESSADTFTLPKVPQIPSFPFQNLSRNNFLNNTVNSNPPAANTVNRNIPPAEVRAFLDTIGWAETGTTESFGYGILVFGGFFNNFSTHPKIKQCSYINSKRICSTAAGRYQIMDFNWDRLAPLLALKDFSPASQDKMALHFIQEKGALEDVVAGRFDEAVCKVGGVWASFPCNQYGQNPKSMDTLRQFYQQRLLFHQNWGNTVSLLPQP